MKISEGDRIKHTPGSDLAAGDIVDLSSLIGIADAAIEAGKVGELTVAGLFELPRVSAVITAIPAGSSIYWSTANQYAQSSSSGAFFIGYSVEVSQKLDDRIKVLLCQ